MQENPMTKFFNLIFVLAAVSLVGCGGKTGRKYSPNPVSTGFAVAIVSSQAASGDLLLTTFLTSGSAGEEVSTVQYTVEKELQNGQRLAIPFQFETQPPHTVRVIGTSLSDAVRVRVQVEAISTLGARATASVVLEGFGIGVDFVPHPMNPNMVQVRITRQDNAATPARLVDVVTLNSQDQIVKALFSNQVLGVGGLQSVALVDATIERRLRITVWNEASSSTAVVELDIQLGQSVQQVLLQ